MFAEAEAAHIPFLAANMREADRKECAAFGRSPADGLAHGLRSSLWALSAIVEGEPHAMIGVSPRNMLEGVGVPWMLGTELVYDHARDLVRHTAPILAEMQTGFQRLENLVSTDNDRAIRFLRWAGFDIGAEPTVIGGVEFVHFERR